MGLANRPQPRSIRVALALTMTALAACTSPSTALRTASPPEGPARPGDNTACRAVNAKVLEVADLPAAVALIPEQSAVRDGVSMCTYGDEADPHLLSLNSLILTVDTPGFRDSRNLSPQADAGLDTKSLCAPGTIRQLGPDAGIGSYARFCIGTPGSSRGGWIVNGSVCHLSFYSPRDAKRSTGERLSRIEAIAKAVDVNLPR